MGQQRSQPVWGERRVVREYAAAEGFLDAGERAAYERIAAGARGEAILDLGVGAGRTVPLLRPLASRYVAVDSEPAMAAACARRFPGTDVRRGDARDLGDFPAGAFGLVVFSFNGMDALAHEDRSRVLREAARVLRPGGALWFSTLNQDGMGRRMRPWVPEWPPRTRGTLRYALRLLRMPAQMLKRTRNYARVRGRFTRGDGWCTGTLSAHDYRLLVHYTSLPAVLRELAQAGFEPDPLVLDNAGAALRAGVDAHDVFWFQIVARKRA